MRSILKKNIIIHADILRGVADEFKREAKSNILEAKNGDDE